jgi:hypothetical protein
MLAICCSNLKYGAYDIQYRHVQEVSTVVVAAVTAASYKSFVLNHVLMMRKAELVLCTRITDL